MKHIACSLAMAFFILNSGCADDDPGKNGMDGETGYILVIQDGANNYIGTTDSTVADDSLADTNYGTSPALSVGYSGVANARTLLRFDCASALPSPVTVTRAFLKIRVSDTSGPLVTATLSVITKTWIESLVTWNTPGSGIWDTTGGDFTDAILSGIELPGNTNITLELPAALVQSWFDNHAENFGMLLKSDNESASGGIANLRSREYNTTPAERPGLIVYAIID
ncbi:MAG: DNRLRE domain-containing protein [Spirochaetes bacterium]|nr:DNRLRE domain-containing protein [Spirochaetota bacterium]